MGRVRTLMVCAVLLAACAGSHGMNDRTTATTTTARPAVPRVCHASGARSGVRQLDSRAGSVWVWIESGAGRRFRVGSLVKVVWRITGTADPKALLSDPYGRSVKLSFGPELHGVSTFVHAGAEYGTGFVPNMPGCWQFGMRRGAVEGRLFLAVVP